MTGNIPRTILVSTTSKEVKSSTGKVSVELLNVVNAGEGEIVTVSNTPQRGWHSVIEIGNKLYARHPTEPWHVPLSLPLLNELFLTKRDLSEVNCVVHVLSSSCQLVKATPEIIQSLRVPSLTSEDIGKLVTYGGKYWYLIEIDVLRDKVHLCSSTFDMEDAVKEVNWSKFATKGSIISAEPSPFVLEWLCSVKKNWRWASQVSITSYAPLALRMSLSEVVLDGRAIADEASWDTLLEEVRKRLVRQVLPEESFFTATRYWRKAIGLSVRVFYQLLEEHGDYFVSSGWFSSQKSILRPDGLPDSLKLSEEEGIRLFRGALTFKNKQVAPTCRFYFENSNLEPCEELELSSPALIREHLKQRLLSTGCTLVVSMELVSFVDEEGRSQRRVLLSPMTCVKPK